MHWFLAEESSSNLKTYLLNIWVYKLSFCYFHHDEIYLLHENVHEFSLEGLYKTWKECWNGRLQIWGQKSNTCKQKP